MKTLPNMDMLATAPELHGGAFFNSVKMPFFWIGLRGKQKMTNFISLSGCTIERDFKLDSLEARAGLSLRVCRIDGGVWIEGSTFQSPLEIFQTRVGQDTYIQSSRFDAGLDMMLCTFPMVRLDSIVKHPFDEGRAPGTGVGLYSFFNVQEVTTRGHALFSGSKFECPVYFGDDSLSGYTDFGRAQFSESVIFEGCIIRDTLDLTKARFDKEVSFLRTRFDGLRSLLLENMQYEDGKLRVDWNQWAANGTPRIRIADSSDAIDQYRRLERIYTKLAGNYLAQDNTSSHDDVLYELARQRERVLCEWWQRVYGWTFGYGFRPWYLLFWVIGIVAMFAALWWRSYYRIVCEILSAGEQSEEHAQTKRKRRLSHRFHMKALASSTDGGYWLAKTLQVVLFSASVLLSIRFKRQWIYSRNRRFLWFVTIEYLLGIAIIVYFALGVKTSQFAFIRGFLGL